MRLQHLPITGASLTLPMALPEAQLLAWCRREYSNWLELLTSEAGAGSDANRLLWDLMARYRAWLISDRQAPPGIVGQLCAAFRRRRPDAPVLREILEEGERWIVVGETRFDDVQILSRAAAAAWEPRVAELRLASIRGEFMLVDQLTVLQTHDVTWSDDAGKLFQLMALYARPDGRWVFPRILSGWSADALRTLASLLDEAARRAKPNQLIITDSVLAELLGRHQTGRTFPGFESYAALVQQTARYRWAARRAPLGRVLDCAASTGFGRQILLDGDGLLSFMGIDSDPGVVSFGLRLTAGTEDGGRIESRPLNSLPQAAYDTVICFETLQRAADPDRFLWDLSERIAPGGKLYLSVPAERWAGTHLSAANATNWSETRVRALCGRVFESVRLLRMRLAAISPGTLEAALLHEGFADAGEDEGFMLTLEAPRKRTLAPRVVVTRAYALGDALLATSIVGSLRRRYPDRQLVMRSRVVEAFQALDDIDIVGSMAVAIRPDDIVIDLDGSYESRRELHIIDAYAEKSGVTAGAPRLIRLTQDYRAIGAKLIQTAWFADDPLPHLIAIHMAAVGDRSWPQEQWTRLLTRLMEKKFAVVLLGAGRDVGADALPGEWRSRIVSIVGEARLAQSAAAIEIADALVAPDSGLIHVAHAVRTPVIGLFGMAEPAHRLPLQGASVGLIADIACKGCLKDLAPESPVHCRREHAYCMDEIPAASVWEALQKLIAVTAPFQWQQRLLRSLPLPIAADRYVTRQNQAAVCRNAER